MTPVLAVSVVAAILASLVGVGVAVTALSRVNEARTDAALAMQGHSRLMAVELKVDALPTQWANERGRMEEESERAKKRWASARAAESRARKLALESDEGGDDDDDDDDDAEWAELQRLSAPALRDVDAGGRPAEGLQPMRTGLAGDAPEDLYERALSQGWTPYI